MSQMHSCRKQRIILQAIFVRVFWQKVATTLTLAAREWDNSLMARGILCRARLHWELQDNAEFDECDGTAPQRRA